MPDISRRNATQMIATMAAAMATPSSAMALGKPVARRFPKDFIWGCATAAYQIEGAVNEDGRGRSIWDDYAHTPGKIKDGMTADVACDSYHRYPEDTRLMKNLGANAYRFSIAWPRIFPDGRGTPNPRGMDHYKRVVDNLLANGIDPHITLYHWDLPSALPGGWQSRDTAAAYADYAGYVASQLSDRVSHFMTLNEIGSFIEIGYGAGFQAPGLQLSRAKLNQARHHALLAHGLGVQAIRAHGRRGTKVGLAENPASMIPVIESPAHIAAAKAAFRSFNGARFVTIMDGAYPAEFLRAEGAGAPVVAAGDMAAIGSNLDFVGLNIYTGLYAQASEAASGFQFVPGGAGYPDMGLSWLKMAPESIYWAIRLISEIWGPKAIYISENGSVAKDRLASGRVGDAERLMYLRAYLGQAQRAAAEGYPLKGYFLWSLLDNFEWSEGFTARFGIHYTDYATQQRTPKLSAAWYKEVIARNGMA